MPASSSETPKILLDSPHYMKPHFFLFLILVACTSATETSPPAPVAEPAYTSWAVGDTSDVRSQPIGGTLLMGGGKDVDAAMRWLLKRADGGDVVIIRATGGDGYNQYLFDLQKVNSVETILINSRDLANNPAIERKIRNAEALFMAGGDQANYVDFWKDTKTEDAINYLINSKKVVVGGTSAGCGILGKTYFSALNGTVTSEEALANPYDSRVALQKDDFLDNALFDNVITDMHYINRERRGRQLVFMARMAKDWNIAQPRGIGIDEKTAVCVEPNGKALVFGSGDAYFLEAIEKPERCESQQTLDWNRKQKAVTAHVLTGTETGEAIFDVAKWKAIKGAITQNWYVENGVLKN